MTINSKLIKNDASCATFGDWAIKNKLNVSKSNTPKRGDIVLFDFNHNGTSDHVGIVTSASGNTVHTIEGNTSISSDDNGGCVMKRTRYKSQINYFVRPKYTKDVTAEMIVQTALAEVGTKEKPSGSNKVKYNTWYYGKEVRGSAYPWCMVFVSWIFAHVKETEKTVETVETVKTSSETEKTSSTKNLCIDTSYWQGKHSVEDWKKVAKKCGFALHRASYTSQSSFSLHDDSTFLENFKNAKEAGLKCGAYHYSQAITISEAKKEAEYLCDRLKGLDVDFYVCCDYEFGKRLNSKIGTKASEIANAFCDVVKARGYSPLIYGNLQMMNGYLKSPNYPVWLAQYNSKCDYKKPYVMWQYTSSGSVSGISGRVDLSHVYAEPTPEGKGYDGTFPSISVKKTSAQAIQDALNWGRAITKDNDFHYGEYGRKKHKGEAIYSVTHRSGCHFCNTNHSKKVVKANALGYKGENWERSYVCNTFVTACYAHGAMESVCLTKCRKGSCIGMNDEGRSPALDKSKNWKYMGKLKIKDLKAGDVLVSEPHMQMVYAPVSSTQVQICEATSYEGKYKSAASNNSIRIIKKKPSYTSVYRFIGTVEGMIPIRHGEYSERAKQLQAYLNWYFGSKVVDADGFIGDISLKYIKQFQSEQGLTADGEFGSKSLEAAKAVKK